MEQEQKLALATLIRQQRWAGLATVDHEDQPLATMVAYAYAADFSTFYIHISKLSQHTRNILENAKISLVITETDNGEGDPQTFARVSISGEIEVVERNSLAYESIKQTYLNHLPTAEPLFGFSDFVLCQLKPKSLRFVGGFAQAHSLTAKTLIECAKLS